LIFALTFVSSLNIKFVIALKRNDFSFQRLNVVDTTR
jgi:hypothetical protein